MDIQGIEELANAANSISPMRDELKETRPKFEDLCMRLNVDEATSLRAWDYIAHLPNSEITPENERFWLTCALYIAGSRRFCSLVSGDSNSAGIGSLSQLLRASNIRLVDFFEPLKAFINLLQLGKPFEEQLKQVEKNFVVMCILFQKYEKLFDSLFHSSGDPVQERGNKKKGSQENGIKTFGWSLFLICKGKLLQDPPDLVQAFHLLLCCVNLLLTHVPGHMRKIRSESQFGGQSSEGEPHLMNTLKYLCKVNNALEDEVSSMEKNFLAYIKSLAAKKVLRNTPGATPTDSILHTVYLGGLLDTFLQRNIQNVNQEYDLIHYSSGDLDERLFLEHSEQIGTPSRIASQSRSYHNYRPPNTSEWDKYSSFASPLNKTAATPPHHPPQTPLSSTMSTLSWLKSTLSDREDQPSTTLRRFFRASNPDPSAAIESRVKDMGEKLNHTVQDLYTSSADSQNNNNNNISTATSTTETAKPTPTNGNANNNNNNGKIRRSISISNDASNNNSNDSFASLNDASNPPSQQHSQVSEAYSQSQEDSQESIASQESDGLARLSRSQGSEFESQGSEMLSQVSEPSSQGYEANSEASDSPPHDENNIIRSNSNMSDINSDVDTYMNIDEFSSGEEADKESKRENEANTLANTIANASSPPTSSPTGPPLPIMPPTVRWMEEWEHRKSFIVKLYYKVLESILLAEEARLHTDNFATLLGHEFFHKSLFACSAEIVLYAYKMIDLSFPAVLRVFDLSPFDFCKLIENVVRLETGLPRALVRHLGKIEEQILESFAWEEGSPVFGLLQQQKDHQPGVRSTPKKTTMPPPSLAFASPVKGAKGVSTGTTTKGTSLSLELFMRKVELLFTIRGQHLCANLQLPSAIFQQLWKTLVHAVTQEPTLTRNRHIDQVLMASLYGVCRANQLNITFKSIIEKYSMQPQASSKIYREVLINPSEEKRSDIINFYNNVYIPVMQQFLLTLASDTPSSSTPTPTISTPSKSTVPFSPMRTARSPMPQHNIYVSPMTTRTAPRTNTAHLTSAPSLLSSTPRASLYNFGNHPRDLRQINAQINSPAPASASMASPAPSHAQSSASPSHTRRAKRQLFDAEPQFLANHSNAEVLETLENSLPSKRRLTLTDSSKSEGSNHRTNNNNNENKNGKSNKSDDNSNDDDNSDDSSSTTSTSTKSSPPPPSDISNVQYPSST